MIRNDRALWEFGWIMTQAFQEVLGSIREAYLGLLVSIPLVLAGILLTGTLFWYVTVRPVTKERGWRHLFAYLFPKYMYTSASAMVDIKVWLLNGLLFIPLFEASIIIAGLAFGIGFLDSLQQTFGPGPILATNLVSVLAIQFLGFWFGQGLGQYSGHLALHRVPVLWAVHRAHHSAESANLFAFLRSHPLEHFINGSTRVAGTAAGTAVAIFVTGGKLLPETTATIFWYNIAYVLIGFRSVDHLHIPVSYGRVLDVLVGSPIMHQVHHSAEERHRDVNMAGAGYLFDWLFGTLYIPSKGETWRWGLNEEELGASNPHNTLKGFFLEPIQNMLRETGRWLGSSLDQRSERDPQS